MNLFFVDIDNTLSDARSRLKEAGKMPVYNKENPKLFNTWLAKIHEPSKLAQDPAVKVVSDIVKAMSRLYQVYYLTSRGEENRNITEEWLASKGLPSRRVLMRPPGNVQPNGRLKETIIKGMIGSNPDAIEVTVMDDDPDMDLEEVCVDNKWTFIKVVLG